MRFLDVSLSDDKLNVCGSQDILSDLRLQIPNQHIGSFRDCKQIVVYSSSTTVPLDLIFLDIYTQASNLSGTIVNESRSAIQLVQMSQFKSEADYERIFEHRYSNDDIEFTEYAEKPSPSPPVFEGWISRNNRHNSSNSRHFSRQANSYRRRGDSRRHD
nr:hypothetical transcript [Hymenolepis microstoma]